MRIANNRIINNAGTNLAGGIGLFAGSDGYEVADNDICGNFSFEYGGGLTVYGLSPDGLIHHNRITLNISNDEGGGIMIAGQLPANPDDLSPGIRSGRHLRQPDPGQPRQRRRWRHPVPDGRGNSPMNVYNNMIANNVSTHEGGGISLNDAPDVRVYNNTIMKNITTATAVTSQRAAGPSGAVHLGQQRPAAGHPARRCPDVQRPGAVQQHLLGQPGGHACRGRP